MWVWKGRDRNAGKLHSDGTEGVGLELETAEAEHGDGGLGVRFGLGKHERVVGGPSKDDGVHISSLQGVPDGGTGVVLSSPRDGSIDAVTVYFQPGSNLEQAFGKHRNDHSLGGWSDVQEHVASASDRGSELTQERVDGEHIVDVCVPSVSP